jgi:Ras-related protein Rab-6A
MVRLQLWDTAGQERFKSLIPSYLKDAHLALVIFDLSSNLFPYSDLPSAESIAKWVDFVREAGKKDIKIYVIGNKCDLDNEIVVDARRLAQNITEKQAEYYR